MVGAGGHAHVVIDMLLQQNKYEIVGCLDPSGGYCGEIPVLGDDNLLENLYEQGVHNAFVALGSNKIRKRIFEKCHNIGYSMINVISSNAVVSPRAKMGQGNIIMHGAIINAGTQIGDGCIINTNASVDHDCIINDFTHVAPGSAIAGATSVGAECFLGIGCRIIDGIHIGDNVTLGAGAVAINDLQSDATAVGVPARIIK